MKLKKHRIYAKCMRAIALLCSLCICFLCLTGCNTTTSTLPQPTFEELMTEINAEHQSVKRGQLDLTPYLRTDITTADLNASITTYYGKALMGEYEAYDGDLELTAQQAREDVEYLFEALYRMYVLYDYFGGKEAFDAAETAILQELETKQSLTCNELAKIMLPYFEFVKDEHFTINFNYTNPIIIPFFFRETAFLKTADGYQTVEGQEVASVDGYEDLDALFKRSISPEGNLVYYPILLKENKEATLSTSQESDETLTIRYADGTVQELTAEPYQLYRETGDSVTSFWQDGDIPVFKFDQWDTTYETEILEGAEKLKGAATSFLDLRSNIGGKEELVTNWMKTYSGKSRLASNGVSYSVYTGKADSALPDGWMKHEDTLVILTGKVTASASERLIDMAYNLENVLLIGENTSGALRGGVSYMQLPNSKCFIGMDCYRVYLMPDDSDYFEEFRGFYPDIWVPAAEAEELAVKLMEQLKK